MIKNFGSGINNVASDFDKVNTSSNALTGTFANIATRFAGIAAIGVTLKHTLGASVAASNEAEAAGTALAQALKQQGIYTEKTMSDLNTYAKSLQEVSGIDDDLTVRTMAQLTAMGLQGDALKKATALSQDLSVVMGTDASSAARVMADAFNGNVGMLGRYIKGLDEADIKQRGAVSIIEQLQRAVGGQAEAFGNTGAGAIKKFEASLSDFKETVGDLVKNTLGPVADLLRGLIKELNNASPVLHMLGLQVITLSAVFIAFNSRLGATPYIVGAIAIALLELVKAVKEGDWAAVVLIGTITAVSVVVLILGKNIFTLITGIRDLIPAIQLMNQTLIANPWIAIATAVATLALAIYSFYRSSKAAQEEYTKTFTASVKKMVDASLDELNKLDKKSLKIRLDWEIGNAENQIAALKKQIAEAENDPKKTEDEITQLRQRLQYIEESLRGFKQMQSDNEKLQKEVANSAKIAAEIEKMKVQAMTEGTAKRKAMAQSEHSEEMVRLKERLDKGEITQKQYDEFRLLSEQTLAAKLLAIDTKLKTDRDSLKIQSAKSAVELQRDNVLSEIDLDEKLAIARAKSEKEKLKITLDHALLRVQAEFDANLKILNMEAETLSSRFSAKGLSDDERENIRKRLAEIQDERDKITAEAQRKAGTAKIEYQIGVEGESPVGSIKAQEGEISRIQKELAEATTAAKRNELRKQLTDAQNTYDKMSMSAIEYARKIKEQKEEEVRLWKETHEFEMGLISSALDGFRTMWDEYTSGRNDDQRRATEVDFEIYKLDSEKRKEELRKQLTDGKISNERYQLELRRMDIERSQREKSLADSKKTMWDKAYTSIQNTAFKTIGNILARELESLIIETVAVKGAQAEQTVATQTGVASRLVMLGGEILKTLASAAASMVKAVASAIEWQVATFGPFAIATIPASIAGMMGIYNGIKTALGFRLGGRLEKGKPGYFEGEDVEVIAPEETFLDIARGEWLPKLIMKQDQINRQRTIETISKNISIVNERSSITSSDPLVEEMRDELKELKNIMRKKEMSMTVKGTLEGQTFMKENLTKAEHRKEYYSR